MTDIKREALAKELNKGKTTSQSRKRIPLGTRNILTAPTRKGFVRRFVNDKGDRIQMFKDAGWEIVTGAGEAGDDKIGRATSMGSGTNPSVGENQRAILMELPEDLYQADIAESQAKITQVENQIKRNSSVEDHNGLSGKIEIR